MKQSGGTVAQIIGHNPKMLLDHYQHVADIQKRAAVEKLPDIPMVKLRQKITAKDTSEKSLTRP
jgi:hypothetical protein